jgi:hypothetical protein
MPAYPRTKTESRCWPGGGSKDRPADFAPIIRLCHQVGPTSAKPWGKWWLVDLAVSTLR